MDQAGEINSVNVQRAGAIAAKLLAYCEAKDWAGYDPYDALNSKLLRALPFLDTKLVRLGMTQLLKRAPVNVRPLLLIPETRNPKGLALFLKSLLKLQQCGMSVAQNGISRLVNQMQELRAPDQRYWAWGYSFPWQGRNLLVPRGTPNLICTMFVADALFDLYENTADTSALQMALNGGEYLLNELYWTEGADVAGFAYPLPTARSQVHNANFLAAALLCRVWKHAGEQKYLDAALRVARYSAGRQRKDGSWLYGELPSQNWIDNFHTGYNLCGLRTIAEIVRTEEFDAVIERGFRFYLSHFFAEGGVAMYYHDRIYPVDVHSVAQSIITLLTFKDLDVRSISLAERVLDWAVKNLWDSRGYFYHQKQKWGTVRISYMRWGQAWMLLALASFMEEGAVASGARLNCSAAASKEVIA